MWLACCCLRFCWVVGIAVFAVMLMIVYLFDCCVYLVDLVSCVFGWFWVRLWVLVVLNFACCLDVCGFVFVGVVLRLGLFVWVAGVTAVVFGLDWRFVFGVLAVVFSGY